MAAPLTEAAIEQVRQLIGEGTLAPGQRLPPEGELADLLGTSRNTVREAVRALVTARVLDVRRGDGTYVTSLRPELLLAGIGAAADLMQDDFTLELLEVRRLLEPAATAIAARRITPETLDELAECLHRMSAAETQEELVVHDEAFHRVVIEAAGNATLASILAGVSSRTTRGRAWRGVIERGATERTISQHSDILAALRDRNPQVAEAAALLHVATTEAWFRGVLAGDDDVVSQVVPGTWSSGTSLPSS